jgi:hypothetical protein
VSRRRLRASHPGAELSTFGDGVRKSAFVHEWVIQIIVENRARPSPNEV